MRTFASVIAETMNDSLAQLVEQLTLNQWVQGSNPWGVTQKRNLTMSNSFFLCQNRNALFNRSSVRRSVGGNSTNVTCDVSVVPNAEGAEWILGRGFRCAQPPGYSYR